MSSTDKFSKVWNFAEPPHEIFLPFVESDAYNGQTSFTFTFSTINSLNEVFSNKLNEIMFDMPMIFSNTDTGISTSLGNDTAWGNTYDWTPDESLIILQLVLRLAVVMNVSAYTNGNFDIGPLSFQAYVDAGGTGTERLKQTIPSIIIPPYNPTVLTAVGVNMSIFNYVYSSPFTVDAGTALTFFPYASSPTTGTGTFQEGVAKIFPNTKTQGLKPLFISGISLWCIPDTDSSRELISLRGDEFK